MFDKKYISGIATVIVVIGVFAFVGYSYFNDSKSPEMLRIEEYQTKIVELEKSVEQSKLNIQELEIQSAEAEKRAAESAKQASLWRKKYNEIDTARKSQPKTKSGKEAVVEMKREGWIR